MKNWHCAWVWGWFLLALRKVPGLRWNKLEVRPQDRIIHRHNDIDISPIPHFCPTHTCHIGYLFVTPVSQISPTTHVFNIHVYGQLFTKQPEWAFTATPCLLLIRHSRKSLCVRLSCSPPTILRGEREILCARQVYLQVYRYTCSWVATIGAQLSCWLQQVTRDYFLCLPPSVSTEKVLSDTIVLIEHTIITLSSLAHLKL